MDNSIQSATMQTAAVRPTPGQTTDSAASPPAATPHPKIKITKTSSPPKLDGRLDDPAWQKAATISGFRRTGFNEGQPATEETEVYITYDDQNIYFGFRCLDSDPKRIRANVANRDSALEDDLVTVYLDTFDSQQRAFAFALNPYGIQIDGLSDESGEKDLSWDAVFESKGVIDQQGWTAEAAIPFSMLRFPPAENQDWGMIISRTIPGKMETSSWPPLKRAANSTLSQAGKLTGIEIPSDHNFELTPYLAGGYFADRDEESNNLNGQKFIDIGLDAKYGIRSDLVLDATLNPDFSQIEADVEQIELNRRYELYYEEKRPFFLESTDKFKSPLEVFYSRRIVDPLGGVKLTGTQGSFNFGVLSTWDEGREGSPDALYNVFRLQQDLPNRSAIGLVMTDKEYEGQTARLYNRVLGLDTKIRLADQYTLTLQGLGSWTAAENEGQYLQNSAPAFYADFTRNDGTLTTGLSYLDIAPDFSADAGYIERTDIRNLTGHVKYIFRPENWIRNWAPFTNQTVIFDHDNDLIETQHQYGASFDFRANTSLTVNGTSGQETWRDNRYNKNGFGLSISNNFSKIISGGLIFQSGDAIYYGQEEADDSFLGWNYQASMGLNIKPNSQLNIDLGADWEDFYTKPGGDEVYNIWLLRGSLNYQITPKIFARIMAQSNTRERTLSLNGLFGYVPSPGTVIYLGYNEGLQLGDETFTTGRNLFLKFSYHWQR